VEHWEHKCRLEATRADAASAEGREAAMEEGGV